jgi:prepilin-type processing-associated H-X9-DG protein
MRPGCATFLFCDGRVKPISQQIDRLAYFRLGSRAGGETIEGDY